MRITLNGEQYETEGPMTVADLLKALGLDGARVAVELNLDILPKSDYATEALREGDRLEVVHFVGGGKPQPEVSQ
jgi:thiamine biosynthesis protein ThiS